MSSGGDEKRELLDTSPSSPCKQQQLKFEVGPTTKSESVQEKVLLRETKVSDLFPTKDTADEPEPHKEGSAASFLKKLWRRHLNVPLSAQRKKKFLRWEIHTFLNDKDLGEFIGNVNTIREVREKLSTKVLICFEEKDWHFNTSNNIDGDQDAYKLLCLGSRGKVYDPIVHYYNQLGSTLSSDLSYGDFRSLVFKELRWGDTEYEGFNKAIELKNRNYPEMTDLLIPCVLHDWTTYHNGLYRYDRLIDLHYELWNKVKEEGKFSEILSELLKLKEYASIERDVVECDFHSIRNYVSKRQHEIEWGKTIIFQIAEYFEGMKPVDCSDRGYSLYVKKKIKKAIQLDIIKKWNDIEVDGVNKAINIRNMYFPCIKDLTIAWVLNEWANYNKEQERYWKKINMMCQLWNRAEEKKFQKAEFRKAVRDIYKQRDDLFVKILFNDIQMIKKYIDDSLRKGLNRKAGLLIREWFEIYESTPKPKCDEVSDYTLFVEEKIRKAIELGIIQKGDVENFKAGAQLLEKIEQKNPGFFNYDEH